MRPKLIKIERITRGSQAEDLGLMVGDIITSYYNQPTQSIQELSSAIINTKKIGATEATLVISRNDNIIEAKVRVGEPLGIEYQEYFAHEYNNHSTEQFSRRAIKASAGDYVIARNIAIALTIIGGLITAAGIFTALSGLISESWWVFLSGSSTAIGGLITIMFAQICRAITDNANYTREILNHLTTKQENR